MCVRERNQKKERKMTCVFEIERFGGRDTEGERERKKEREKERKTRKRQ